MTMKANTTSQYFVFFTIIFSLICSALLSEKTFAVDTEIKNPREKILDSTSNQSSNSDELVRKIQVIQIPAQQLNFKYSKFTTKWLVSLNDWNSLWQDSQNSGAAPQLPVNWRSESVLAVSWPSVDDVVRIPAFSGVEINTINGVKQMRLYFNLNTPCFGIITDVSPVQLVVMDHSFSDIDSVVISTQNTKSTGCF